MRVLVPCLCGRIVAALTRLATALDGRSVDWLPCLCAHGSDVGLRRVLQHPSMPPLSAARDGLLLSAFLSKGEQRAGGALGDALSPQGRASLALYRLCRRRAYLFEDDGGDGGADDDGANAAPSPLTTEQQADALLRAGADPNVALRAAFDAAAVEPGVLRALLRHERCSPARVRQLVRQWQHPVEALCEVLASGKCAPSLVRSVAQRSARYLSPRRSGQLDRALEAAGCAPLAGAAAPDWEEETAAAARMGSEELEAESEQQQEEEEERIAQCAYHCHVRAHHARQMEYLGGPGEFSDDEDGNEEEEEDDSDEDAVEEQEAEPAATAVEEAAATVPRAAAAE